MTTSTAIARLNAADPDFAHHLDHLLSWESVSDDSVNQRVLDIIKAVRERGDAALGDGQVDGADGDLAAVLLQHFGEVDHRRPFLRMTMRNKVPPTTSMMIETTPWA